MVDNRENSPFLEGQAPNCPEFQRSPWQKDGRETWFNPKLCTSGEEDEDNEDELGIAESSREDEPKDN